MNAPCKDCKDCKDCKEILGWHLDKKVPISLILALIIQAIAFTIFIDRMDNRIAVLEEWQSKSESSVSRLPADLEYIKYTLQRMERKLDEKE